MEEHWSEEDVKNAKEWTIKMVKLPLIYSKFPLLTSEMLLQMLDHQTTHRHTTTPSQRTHLAGDLNHAWQKLNKTNLKLGMLLLPQSRKLKTMSLRLEKIASMQLQWVSAILYYI